MHRVFLGLAKLMAIVGGFVLSLLVAIIALSIVGRELNSLLHGSPFAATGFATWLLGLDLPGVWGPIRLGPVNGDYELVEAGIAFAIFSFLPLAHLSGAHATVDIFTARMPEPAQRVLTLVIHIAFALVLVTIAVQLYHGTVDKFARHQTTLQLQFPVWWGFALSLLGATLAAVVAVYLAAVRLVETVTGRDIVPAGEGADL